MEEGTVVNALYQVRASVRYLQNLSRLSVELNFPTTLRSNLQHAVFRTDINAIDVLPSVNRRFRDRHRALEHMGERYRR